MFSTRGSRISSDDSTSQLMIRCCLMSTRKVHWIGRPSFCDQGVNSFLAFALSHYVQYRVTPDSDISRGYSNWNIVLDSNATTTPSAPPPPPPPTPPPPLAPASEYGSHRQLNIGMTFHGDTFHITGLLYIRAISIRFESSKCEAFLLRAKSYLQWS